MLLLTTCACSLLFLVRTVVVDVVFIHFRRWSKRKSEDEEMKKVSLSLFLSRSYSSFKIFEFQINFKKRVRGRGNRTFWKRRAAAAASPAFVTLEILCVAMVTSSSSLQPSLVPWSSLSISSRLSMLGFFFRRILSAVVWRSCSSSEECFELCSVACTYAIWSAPDESGSDGRGRYCRSAQ